MNKNLLLVSIAYLVLFSPLFGMKRPSSQVPSIPEEPSVKKQRISELNITTDDGSAYVIEENLINQMITIREMYNVLDEDDVTNDSIPIPVKSKTLEEIILILNTLENIGDAGEQKKEVDRFLKNTYLNSELYDELRDFLVAINYLDAENLMELVVDTFFVEDIETLIFIIERLNTNKVYTIPYFKVALQMADGITDALNSNVIIRRKDNKLIAHQLQKVVSKTLIDTNMLTGDRFAGYIDFLKFAMNYFGGRSQILDNIIRTIIYHTNEISPVQNASSQSMNLRVKLNSINEIIDKIFVGVNLDFTDVSNREKKNFIYFNGPIKKNVIEKIIGIPVDSEMSVGDYITLHPNKNDFAEVGLTSLEGLSLLENANLIGELSFYDNYIYRIEPGIFDSFAMLTELYFSTNYLTYLQLGVFDGLKNLSKLTLSYNMIEYIDVDVFNSLINLKHIVLDENRYLKNFNDIAFNNLRSLKHIELDIELLNNKIFELFATLPNLNQVSNDNFGLTRERADRLKEFLETNNIEVNEYGFDFTIFFSIIN